MPDLPAKRDTGIVADADWQSTVRPAGGDLSARVSGRSVILLIDTSYSMDGKPLREARRGSSAFIREAARGRWKVGLAEFNAGVRILAKPGEDAAVLESRLPERTHGSTAMHLAIREGISLLPEADRQRVLCLVTDGEPDDREETLAAAKSAKALGIDIMTIGVEGADHAFLGQLATRRELATESRVERLALDMAMAGKALRSLPSPGRG